MGQIAIAKDQYLPTRPSQGEGPKVEGSNPFPATAQRQGYSETEARSGPGTSVLSNSQPASGGKATSQQTC